MTRQVLLVALALVAGSVLVTLAMIEVFYPGSDGIWMALAVAVAVPVLIGVPTIWFLFSQDKKVRRLHERLREATEELKGLHDEAERRASLDAVTGLLNRESFMVRSRFRRRRTDAGYLLIIDIDQFKDVRDLHGPEAGDKALLAVVRVLRDEIRETDTLGRIGDEEFALFLSDMSPEKAWDMAESIRRGVERVPFLPLPGVQVRLTVSIGIAPAPVNQRMYDIMVHADRSLFAARHGGRNRVAFRPRPDDEEVHRLNRLSYSKAS